MSGALVLAETVGAPDSVETELISVVVCTTGRRASLWDLLSCLQALDDAAHEVLVVENTPSPALDPARIAALGARLVVERRPGLDAARNRGARNAAGSIVAYVDDDCLVRPGWLTGLRRSFADPAVALVTGRVVPDRLDLDSERWFEACFPWDRGELPIRFERRTSRPHFPAAMHHLGTGCNMAFRRTVLLDLGGFDEALDMGSLVGGGGDMDMFARVIDAGLPAVYEPTAIVQHRHRVTLHDLRWQVWGYGVAQGAVAAKGILTRPGLRADVARFWWLRLRARWAEVRRHWRRRGPLPRSIVVLETAGMAIGPAAYGVSVVHAWVRRRRR